MGHIPAKADVEAQEAFFKKKLQPRLEQAQAGQRSLFFVNAVYFVLAPLWGFVWSLTRLSVSYTHLTLPTKA